MNISKEALLSFGKLMNHEQKIIALLMDGPFYGSFGRMAKTMGYKPGLIPAIHKGCHHLEELGVIRINFIGKRVYSTHLTDEWEKKLCGISDR